MGRFGVVVGISVSCCTIFYRLGRHIRRETAMILKLITLIYLFEVSTTDFFTLTKTVGKLSNYFAQRKGRAEAKKEDEVSD